MTAPARRRSRYALATLAAIVVTVTVVACAGPGRPPGRAFPPLHPAAAPAGWPRAALPGGTGVLSYPPSLHPLYPVRELCAGVLFFPIQRSAEVLHAWRQWTGTVPDEVTSIGRILRLPHVPEAPELLRGRAFALVEAAHLGDAATGAGLIRPAARARPGAGHLRHYPRPRAAPAAHGP